jgi:hypothetical protein
LPQSKQRESINTALQNKWFGNYLPLIMIVLIVAIVIGILSTPRLMHKDFSLLIAAEAQKTEDFKSEYEDKLASTAAALEAELVAIDAQELRLKATEHYKGLLKSRKSFDSRFALTPREKTQVLMLNLSSDSTKAFHDVIRSVAREASPIGAIIRVNESTEGIALHIDFEMSSMTSGERGTRTKHTTIESLQKEVTTLISRVTNDIFQFSSGLNISSIYVGCTHHVNTTHFDGSRGEENQLLYKIKIQNNKLPKLTNNPFLDIYSTTNYFNVVEDNFDQITISTS